MNEDRPQTGDSPEAIVHNIGEFQEERGRRLREKGKDQGNWAQGNETVPKATFDIAIETAAIAENKAAHLEQVSLTDPLTLLPNRRAFTQDINRYVKEFKRTEEQNSPEELAIVYLDLDYFKQVNDKLGHDMGDSVLRLMSTIAEESIRNGLLYRLGGDEFAAILKGAKKEHIPKIVDRLRMLLSEKTSLLYETSAPGVEMDPVGITSGFAIYDGHESSEEFVRRADLAETKAKETKRGITMFSPSMNEEPTQIEIPTEYDLKKAS